MTALKALIDADIITYRVGYAADKKVYMPTVNGIVYDTLTSAAEVKEFKAQHLGEDIEIERQLVVQPLDHCLTMVRTSLLAIQDVVGSNHELYLTGRGNFRLQLATIAKYKGNRSEFERPTHYADIREYMQRVWGARVIDDQEADDEIGIRAYEINEGSEEKAVVVSIDKDLDTVAGFHYNFVMGAKYKISDEQAIRCFYLQLLTGDRTDNITGIKGIGPKTAEKILGDIRKEKQLWLAVRDAWDVHYPDGVPCEDGRTISVTEALLETGRLLWIRRERNESLWEPPV